jgi:hypothetical protein
MSRNNIPFFGQSGTLRMYFSRLIPSFAIFVVLPYFFSSAFQADKRSACLPSVIYCGYAYGKLQALSSQHFSISRRQNCVGDLKPY